MIFLIHVLVEWRSTKLVEYELLRISNGQEFVRLSSSKITECESNMQSYNTKYQCFQHQIQCNYWNSWVQFGSSSLNVVDFESPPKICPMPRNALFVIQPTVGSGICLLWIEKHSTLCCWFNCTSLYSSFVGHAYIIVFLTWKTMKYVIKTPIIQSSCSMTSMKLSSQIKLVV